MFCGIRISLFKVLIALIIIIGIIFNTVDILMINLTKSISRSFSGSEWNWEFERKQEEYDWNASYFVNTVGCKMPSLPVNGEHIAKFMLKYKSPVRCSIPMTKTNNDSLWISLNETELDIHYGVKDVNELNCSYVPFYRKTDDNNDHYKNMSTTFSFGETVKVNYEFIKVVCKSSVTNSEIYVDHHFFLLMPATVNVTDSKYEPNIMVIGIDSLSRLNFHRQMNKSVSFMLNELEAIELLGYNKLADNTYPNLIPALTGLDEREFTDACVPKQTSKFDTCHFIWDQYKSLNYSTLFAEDTGSMGLFNYHRSGFTKQPTDYYLRPILVELENSKQSKLVHGIYYCLGYRKSFDLFIEFITKFIDSIGSNPYFSFFWSSTISHNELCAPQMIDDSFTEFLSRLRDEIENTFLFIMSDHGIRFGDYRNTYQGSMEERQPALFLVPPRTFADKYPNAVQNLLKNRRKLTTHFDLHETLRDLTDIEVISNESIQKRSHELLDTEPMPRGISLFLPIPISRTCDLAGISSHWCTCHEKQELPSTDSEVVKSASFIVEELNKIIKVFPQCHPLSLDSISDANRLSTSSEINVNEKDKNQFFDIIVRLQTKPGFGEFEATVRVYNVSLNLVGTISRTNSYGNQSHCVDDYHAELYCYCNSFM